MGMIQVGATTISAKVALGSKITPVRRAKWLICAGVCASAAGKDAGFAAIEVPPRKDFADITHQDGEKYQLLISLRANRPGRVARLSGRCRFGHLGNGG